MIANRFFATFSACAVLTLSICANAQTAPAGPAAKGTPAKIAAKEARKKEVTMVAPEDRYTFAVSEGTSGRIDIPEAIAKYRPLADVMEKSLGKTVVVTLVRNVEALETGMKSGEFDLVMARPSDYPARGIRDYKYNLVATSKPDGQCIFIVEKTSLLKSIADIKGKKIMFPEKIAYMSRLCTAELRDKGINAASEKITYASDVASEKITYAREQGAVGWSVENKLMEVGGVASYSGVAKNWEKSGQRILHKSVPQPYSPLIASPRVPIDKLAKLKSALADLEKNEAGLKVLQSIGIQGLNPESPERLLALLVWLEKPAT